MLNQCNGKTKRGKVDNERKRYTERERERVFEGE